MKKAPPPSADAIADRICRGSTNARRPPVFRRATHPGASVAVLRKTARYCCVAFLILLFDARSPAALASASHIYAPCLVVP
jgi:hypothetical protein